MGETTRGIEFSTAHWRKLHRTRYIVPSGPPLLVTPGACSTLFSAPSFREGDIEMVGWLAVNLTIDPQAVSVSADESV